MEREAESPVAGKAEEQSGSLLYTYFQGDINSMVDAHFSRALSKATKPRADIIKIKKARKPVKTESPGSSNWEVQSPPHFGATMYTSGRIQYGRREELQTNPHLAPLSPAESSTIWADSPRQGSSLVLPPMVYPSAASGKGLVPDQQYGSSLLNLLHTDRPDLGSVMVSASKHEFIPRWTRHPGFEDQTTPHHSLDSGMQMIEKKDLYWY